MCCVRSIRVKPYKMPLMPDLPIGKVSTDLPFSNTGVDFTGLLHTVQSTYSFTLARCFLHGKSHFSVYIDKSKSHAWIKLEPCMGALHFTHFVAHREFHHHTWAIHMCKCHGMIIIPVKHYSSEELC